MDQPDFYTIFDECIARLEQGASVEDCLQAYPEFAESLAPALATTAELLQLSPLAPSAETTAQGLNAVMAAFDSQPKPSPSIFHVIRDILAKWQRPKPRQNPVRFALQMAIVLVMFLFVGSGFAITAAADSLPGQTLYPIKRTWENTRLTLTLDETTRKELQTEIHETRRQEVKILLQTRQPEIVEFTGTITILQNDTVTIDDFAIMLTEDTAVIGKLFVGQNTLVTAQIGVDGTLFAITITGKDNSIPVTATPPPTSTPSFTPTMTATPKPTQSPTETSTAIQEERATPTATQGTRITITREFRTTPPFAVTRDTRPTPTATRDGRPDSTATRDDRPTPPSTREYRPTPDPTATRESRPTRSATREIMPTPESTRGVRLTPRPTQRP